MGDHLVTVAEFGSLMEADMYRARLEAEGVYVFVPGENAAALAYPAIGIASRPLQLQVPSSEMDRATAILSEAAEEMSQPVAGEAEAPSANEQATREPGEGGFPATFRGTGMLIFGRMLALLLGILVLAGVFSAIANWLLR